MAIIRTNSAAGRSYRYITETEATDAELDRRVRQFIAYNGEWDYARAFDLVLGDPGKRTLGSS